jgi:hypothetical protein
LTRSGQARGLEADEQLGAAGGGLIGKRENEIKTNGKHANDWDLFLADRLNYWVLFLSKINVLTRVYDRQFSVDCP